MGGVLAQLVAERGAASAIVDIDGNLTRGDCTFSLQASEGLAFVRDDVYRRSATDPPLRGYYAAMSFASPAVFQRDAADLVAMSERGDLAARLVKVPHLYVAGDLPGGICAESRRQLEAAGARWLAVAGTGHWVYLDAPERFAAEVAAFMAAPRS
jgi:pimeloyl-ACP methyl ester carboxylesterase